MPEQALYKFEVDVVDEDGNESTKILVRGGSKKRITEADTEKHVRDVLFKNQPLRAVKVRAIPDSEKVTPPAGAPIVFKDPA